MNRAQVLNGLCEKARPLILEEYNKNSCIACARVTLEVLKHFRLPARPIKVAAYVFNEKYLNLVRADKLSMYDPLPQWALDDGAWATGLGVHGVQQFDDGLHLVVLSDNVLIDLSLDQINRPAKNIVLTPSVFKVRDVATFMRGDAIGPFEMPRNAALIYAADPGSRSYTSAPDWRYASRWRHIAGKVIRYIEKGN